MIVELTDEAERDLEEIADWIAQDHPSRALDFVAELRAKCMGLRRFPERFPLVPRYERHGIRHLVHGKYLIFYRVKLHKVIVIHILSGAMDYAEILFPS